jgi:hypothetical protein
MASTVVYPPDRAASKAAFLEWLPGNADGAALVVMTGEQFVALEDELTPNQRFLACGSEQPSSHHIGVTLEDDPSMAYWIKRDATDFPCSRDEI